MHHTVWSVCFKTYLFMFENTTTKKIPDEKKFSKMDHEHTALNTNPAT